MGVVREVTCRYDQGGIYTVLSINFVAPTTHKPRTKPQLGHSNLTFSSFSPTTTHKVTHFHLPFPRYPFMALFPLLALMVSKLPFSTPIMHLPVVIASPFPTLSRARVLVRTMQCRHQTLTGTTHKIILIWAKMIMLIIMI